MHIFISYSKAETRTLALRLQDAFTALPGITAWVDVSLHSGEDWATQIQDEIDRADLVIVLLSPDVNRSQNHPSGRSFVLKEIHYAQQSKKTIIPVMAQPTRLPVQLAGIQYIDFGGDPETGLKRLVSEIKDRANIPANEMPPLTNMFSPTSDPLPFSITGSHPVAPPTLSSTAPQRTGVSVNQSIILIGMGVVALLILTLVILPALNTTPVATSTTSVGLLPTKSPLTVVATLSPTDTHIDMPRPTATHPPTAVAAALIVTHTNASVPATATASLTSVPPTPTFTLVPPTATFAPTPTPTYTPIPPTSTFTQTPSPTATYTPIPTLTFTPTHTLTPVPPTSTFTPTATSTFTLTPTLAPGFARMTRNASWTSVSQTFNGVEMVLVPVGCFMMGSLDGFDNERPVTERCIETPFWIDKTEVTNSQYGSSGYFMGANHPRDTVTWYEAREFCAVHGKRLPTELEWEYAARGPDSLFYPWSNDFIADNVVYNGNAGRASAEVGGRLAGQSWVGALDMSGNLWEWVSTIYGIYSFSQNSFASLYTYPYYSNDGREDINANDPAFYHVLRGGSWDYGDVEVRTTTRHWGSLTLKDAGLGFRCALSVS